MKKKYKIINETDKTVTFIYEGAECCYAKSCYSSIYEVIKEINEERIREKEADKRIEKERAAMTPDERASWDEADRAVFERWQDEANTNAILDGYEPEEGEDPNFNPFRKTNEE